MADEKLNTGPGSEKLPEAPEQAATPTPRQEQAAAPQQEQAGLAQPAPGDVVVSFDKINELMGEKRQAARAQVEKEAAGKDGKEELPAAGGDKPKTPRRGRPPKEEKAGPAGKEETKPRKGRPPKEDKTASGKAKPPKRDKVSRSDGKAPDAPKGAPVREAAVPEPPAPEPAAPPRPIDEGKLVYLKLSDLHAFHTFRDHPFQVKDDEKMAELVGTIKEHGVMTPATVRPEKDGNGYEIVAGHRRKRASELAGKQTMPVIVRNMDNDEATIIMVDSNLQREKILPSEKAFAYRMKLDAMKHQGQRPVATSVPVAQKSDGKTSRQLLAEQAGESQDQIRRYIRLTYLIPSLLQRVDENKLALRPAVELSYLTREEQELLWEAVSRWEVTPSLGQAQQLKEHSKNKQLNGEIMEDLLSNGKVATVQVTLKGPRLHQYFPEDYTQQQIEDIILSLLKNWKSQQKGAVPNDHDG